MNPTEQIASNRTDRKKENTQHKIISVAVSLFNQLGLETVTMEQIAEAVDIAKGTLYNYFPSKEAIINAYLQQSFQDNSAERILKLRQLPDSRARLTAVFSVLIEGMKRQKQILKRSWSTG